MRRLFEDNLSLGLVVVVTMVLLGGDVLVEAERSGNSNVFDLLDYGGSSSNGLDNSEALMNIWKAACKWSGGGGQAIVNIPTGTYLTRPVVLNGPCTGPIVFRNKGKIMAPPGPSKADNWISFRYVDRLTLDGGGSFDGQGDTVWRRNSGQRSQTLLAFSFVNNSRAQSIHLTNSKNTHFNIYASHDIQLRMITISSPATSPNTDGIKIAESTNINIMDTNIASGDDCVAMLTGSRNITITGVSCGPGHGVSIGSMGGSPNEKVTDINVKNVNFTETLNGVRIKTWASGNPGVVSGVSFKNIVMKDVDNPIVIDQNYCPRRPCGKGNSHVQVEDVKFINIKGTSKRQVALKLDCSGSNPCKDILLSNINLRSDEGTASAECFNVHGTSFGLQYPTPCF